VRSWRIAFVVLAAACAVPLLVTYRLPMIDLPQHAAQITIWKYFDEPCHAFAQKYEQNWYTPYLLGYAVTRAFAALMPVNAAIKLTLWLAILAVPLSMRMLARRAGIDPWLTLLGFPLAFSFSFFWGFLNTVVAVPLAIVFVVLAYDYAREQSARRAIVLACTAVLLTAGHALIFTGAALAAGVLHLSLWRTPKRMLLTAWPYAIPLPFLLLWTGRIADHDRIATGSTMWFAPWTRVVKLFSDLLAADRDPTAMLMSLMLLVVAALAGVRFSREPLRWIPAIVFGALYFAGPDILQGVAYINGRFAVLFAAFLLLAMTPGKALIAKSLARGLIVASVLAWMLVLTGRFSAFGREAEHFDRLVDHLEPNRSMIALVFDRNSAIFPGGAYLQWAAYYQERKGGAINWSFANSFPSLIRYRPGVELRETRGLYLEPRLFRWGTNDSRYDYFVVRAPDASYGAFVFREATEPIALRGRFGNWWLYQRARALPPVHCKPFTPDGPSARRPMLSVVSSQLSAQH
jgi:hypothetical protein